MSSRPLAAAVLAGAAALAGCGGGDDSPTTDREPNGPGDRVSETVPVHVRQHHRQHTGSTYVEGAVPFVRITKRGEEKPAVEELVRDAPQEGRLLSTRVRPGSYVVSSHVRPGSGSGKLDPPVDRCKKPVEVQRAQSVTVTIVRVPGRSCGIRVVRVRFHDLVGKSVEKARAIVKERDFEMRVVKRDGEELPVTQDLTPGRVNVVVEGGEVTEVDGLY